MSASMGFFACSVNIGANPRCSYQEAGGVKKVVIQDAFKESGIGSGGSIEVIFNGIFNSNKAAATDSFGIETFTAFNQEYKIDITNTGLTLTNVCDFPCKKCQPGAPSHCIECIPGGLNLLQGTTCVDKCNQDQVEINNICYPCHSSCGSCKVTNRNDCLSCGKPGFEFLSNGQCIPTCPDGTYGDTTLNRCMSCNSPCSKCSKSSTNCTGCLPG